jgi:hypothetical protein
MNERIRLILKVYGITLISIGIFLIVRDLV